MESPTALLSALERLSVSIDREPALLTAPLVDLGRELKAAVSSYCGVQLTIFTELDLPITLTEFDAEATLSTLGTSLRVSLAALTNSGVDGHITFYGVRPGAFVDLAADLGFALGSGTDGTSTPNISLDQHLEPLTREPSLLGTDDVSIVNRAVGVLIGRGRTPGEAEAELVLGAREAEIPLPAFADHTIRLAQPAR